MFEVVGLVELFEEVALGDITPRSDRWADSGVRPSKAAAWVEEAQPSKRAAVARIEVMGINIL